MMVTKRKKEGISSERNKKQKQLKSNCSKGEIRMRGGVEDKQFIARKYLFLVRRWR